MRALSLVVLAGCWSTPRAVPPADPITPTQPVITSRNRARGPSHCERAIDHVVVLMQPSIDREPMLRDRQQQLRDAAVEGCTTTGWSEAVLTCYDDTVDVGGFQTCFGQLTDDQRTDFNQRMTDTMKQPVP